MAPIKNIIDKAFILYIDLGRHIFEKPPLKYMGAGYWSEKYARKSLKVIQEFEISLKNSKSVPKKELTELIKEAERKLRKNDSNIYKTWFPSMIPLFLLMPFAMINDKTFIPYIILFHEFACPSSLRKYYELKGKGENELAGIVGNRASPSAVQYFKEKYKDLYQIINS